MNGRRTALQTTMAAPAADVQLFRWLPASAPLLGSPRLYSSDYRGHTCCPRGHPERSNTTTQPIKEIWGGCSRRANTHTHTSSTLSMKNEDIRAHKTQLYLSLLLPSPRLPPTPSSPSTLSLHLPTAEATKSNYTCLITSRTIKNAVGGRGGPF